MTTQNEEREEMRQQIRAEWRQILAKWTGTAPRKARGQATYICPLCGNGSGADGDGIAENPKSTTGAGLKCFKCGFAGDIVDLYQRTTGADHNTALKELAEQIGYTADGVTADKKKSFPLSAQKSTATPSTEETPSADFTEYFKLCQKRLTDPRAVAYLEKRGISLKTAKRLHIGYDGLADPANAPGALADDDSRKKYTAPRIIIPTNKGHYVTRAIDDNMPDKYKKLQSKESKSGVFGWRQLNDKLPQIFVCEGAFDALSILDAGAHAIALNSTANTGLLLDILRNDPPRETVFILCLDNDKGGEGATPRLEKGLDELKVLHTRADICGGCKDPNEAYTTDREAFIQALTEAAKSAEEIRAQQTETAAEDPAEDLTEEEPPRMTGAEMLQAFLEAVQERDFEPIPTGIKALDRALQGGFIRKTLVTLGAAPGMGKTALAQWILENMAEAGHNVLYINLEMAREQLLARSISRIAYTREGASVTALKVMRGYEWTDKEREIITKAADYYRERIAENFLYNPPGTTAELQRILATMEREAEHARAEGKPVPIVCIDYLQIIDCGKRETAEGIKAALNAFKDFARDNDTIVLLIVANNRASNASGTAELESGRDTSALEYSGDTVLGLTYTAIDDREKYIFYENDEKGRTTSRTTSEKKIPYTLEIIRQERRRAYEEGKPVPDVCRRLSLKVNKNRFGDAGRVARLVFDGAHSTFREAGAFTVPEQEETAPAGWTGH